MSIDDDVKNMTVWKKINEATKEPMNDKIKLIRKHQDDVQNISNKSNRLLMVNSEIKIMPRAAELRSSRYSEFKVARSVKLE